MNVTSIVNLPTWKSGAEGALGANLMLNGNLKHFNLML